jgi:hypothetical protein
LLQRIIAIAFILGSTTTAWMILAATINARSYQQDGKLTPGVASTWGAPHTQRPPTAVAVKTPLPLESSRVAVRLALDYRQKGLLWFSTYVVDFAGVYTFRNTAAEARPVTFMLTFPAEKAIYDGLLMEVDGRPLPFSTDPHVAFAAAEMGAGQTAVLRVAYRSQGLESWRYKLAEEVSQSRDFLLSMSTNFKPIDFPPDTLSPTEKRATASGWDLTWRYQNLISGFQIGMTMPQKLQPGLLAGEISFFAPVSLLLFFFLIFIITTLRRIDLHPMNYFFLAAAFFSFHLLLAYLADHVSIHLAFVICSAVSLFLTISYLRLAIGLRFALVEAGLAQLVYLVLFSYAFFIPGFTGLAVTLGSILTLFLVMQMTARIRWTERFHSARLTSLSPPA